MTESDYQEIIRLMPCFWCDEVRYGYVSWHHLLCLGQSGKAMKPPPWATVPVCKKCHDKCHSYEISREEQKMAMMTVWVRVGGAIIGEANFWQQLGNSYAGVIGLDD